MFSSFESTALLISFILIFGILTYLVSALVSKNQQHSKSQFLLANRSLGFWESSFSVAATWIWAPALFISAQQAYINGWLGLFWFTVPNILCLILFAFFAEKIKQKFPNGFTLSDYMGSVYSNRVQKTYWFTLIGLTVCAFAVQLLAGGSLISKLTGISFITSTVILAAIPLGYSLVFGLKASVITDFIKMIMILSIGVILIPLTVSSLGGIETVFNGLGGISGKNLNFFSTESLMIFLTFGLPTTIGLLSGPFGDQSFWQRAFATDNSIVKRSFITAAFIFGLVPITMGIIGFLAAGLPLKVDSVQLVNLETIYLALGSIGAGIFFLLVMAGLTSILDSKLCSISSIIGHDLAEKFNLNYLTWSRYSMIALTVAALAIANIPDLKILHLFLFYGTFRSATLIPTVLTLLGKQIDERAVFYGILISIVVGLPIFTYGNMMSSPIWIVTGSLTTLLLPLIFILITNIIRNKLAL